jgi:hypothetical protein
MKIVTTAFVLGLMSTAAIASDVNPQVEIENLQKRVLELQLKKQKSNIPQKQHDMSWSSAFNVKPKHYMVPPAVPTTPVETTKVEEEDSITILCSNDVKPGSIKLTNPPKINCGDMSKAQFAIGTGFTFKSDIPTDDLINMAKGRTSRTRPSYLEGAKRRTRPSYLEGAKRMHETNAYPKFGGTSTLNRYNETTKRAEELDRLESMKKNFVFNENGIGQFTSDFDNPNSKVSNLVRRKRGYRGSGCSANEIIKGAC